MKTPNYVNANDLIDKFRDMAKQNLLLVGNEVSQQQLLEQIVEVIVNTANESLKDPVGAMCDQDTKQTIYNACRNIIIQRISNVCDLPLTKEENITLKQEMIEELKTLVGYAENSTEFEKIYSSLIRNDRPISRNVMRFLTEHFCIPYELTYAKRSRYPNRESFRVRYVFKKIHPEK